MLKKPEIIRSSPNTYVYSNTTLSYVKAYTSITPQKDLLAQWTDYLITDSLVPANQISTDDFVSFLLHF